MDWMKEVSSEDLIGELTSRYKSSFFFGLELETNQFGVSLDGNVMDIIYGVSKVLEKTIEWNAEQIIQEAANANPVE